MIISKISGGLGNQMFQYALGRVLAEKNHDTLKIDLGFYDIFQKIDAPRLFELDVFNTKYDVATRSERIRLSDSNPLIVTMNKILHTNINSYPNGYIREKSKKFDPTIFEGQGNVYLDGFWQSEKYFSDHSDVIRQDFTFHTEPKGKNKSLLKAINNSNSVSVHVRRGDYVSNPATNQFHGVGSLTYYQKATSYIKTKVKTPKVYVFSDDMPWCKANLKLGKDTVFVTHNKGDNSWEDMRLMSHCKHNIIANSSFSWWGAWLNHNPDKIVIAPQKWFNDPHIDTQDVIPDSWLKM